MPVDPALVSSASALLGALIGGSASLGTAIFTQRYQDRLQRVAHEITKRETVYADFLVSASNVLLTAYLNDNIALNADVQRLVGLTHRMRLFAPPQVIEGAEAVIKAIIAVSLKPSMDFRQLAKQALSKLPDPGPLLTFSVLCQADLEHVRRTLP